VSYTSEKRVFIKKKLNLRIVRHKSSLSYTPCIIAILYPLSRQGYRDSVEFLHTLPTMTTNYLHRRTNWTTITICISYLR
jgi:hypothetical protein